MRIVLRAGFSLFFYNPLLYNNVDTDEDAVTQIRNHIGKGLYVL